MSQTSNKIYSSFPRHSLRLERMEPMFQCWEKSATRPMSKITCMSLLRTSRTHPPSTPSRSSALTTKCILLAPYPANTTNISTTLPSSSIPKDSYKPSTTKLISLTSTSLEKSATMSLRPSVPATKFAYLILNTAEWVWAYAMM